MKVFDGYKVKCKGKMDMEDSRGKERKLFGESGKNRNSSVDLPSGLANNSSLRIHSIKYLLVRQINSLDSRISLLTL